MCGAQPFGPARWQVHCSKKAGSGGADKSANPKQRIGGKFMASAIVEPFNGGDELDAALQLAP